MYDVVLSDVANLFLNKLPPEDQDDCRRIILTKLCDNPDPAQNPARKWANYLPNQPGTIECSIGDWFFRYYIINAATIGVASIYYSPTNPKHPFHA